MLVRETVPVLVIDRVADAVIIRLVLAVIDGVLVNDDVGLPEGVTVEVPVCDGVLVEVPVCDGVLVEVPV